MFVHSVEVSECGEVKQDIVLTQDIVTEGDCFIVAKRGVTIDGNGFTIYGPNRDGYLLAPKNKTGAGISNLGGYDNIVIKNFGGIKGFQYAVRADGMRNSVIEDNTMINTTWTGPLQRIRTLGDSSRYYNQHVRGTSIYLTNSNSNTIQNNYIAPFLGDPIYVQGSDNLIDSNEIFLRIGNYDVAVLLESSQRNTISNNEIDTGDYGGVGVYLYESESNVINSNSIVGEVGFDGLIMIEDSSKNTYSDNELIHSEDDFRYGVVNFRSVDNTFTNLNLENKVQLDINNFMGARVLVERAPHQTYLTTMT